MKEYYLKLSKIYTSEFIKSCFMKSEVQELFNNYSVKVLFIEVDEEIKFIKIVVHKAMKMPFGFKDLLEIIKVSGLSCTKVKVTRGYKETNIEKILGYL